MVDFVGCGESDGVKDLEIIQRIVFIAVSSSVLFGNVLTQDMYSQYKQLRTIKYSLSDLSHLKLARLTVLIINVGSFLIWHDESPRAWGQLAGSCVHSKMLLSPRVLIKRQPTMSYEAPLQGCP